MESLIAGGKDWQLLRVSGSGLEEGLPPLLARDGWVGMGVSVNLNVVDAFIFRRAFCCGNSALVPKDASVSFDLVEIDGVFRLLDVVYNDS